MTETRSGFLVLAGLVALCLALWNSVLNQAKARQSSARLLLRKHLASGREYFRAQLKKPHPTLRDEWFPYLIAFGLGKHIDRWFRAFGGERAGSSGGLSSITTSSSSSGTSSTSSTSWSGMGGGGGFAGGGSSGAWAAAAGSMAAGVSAPSSSSSSGGGGGSSSGGSSGGGGGGGW